MSPFDWHNFLILAEDLANSAAESAKRSAISRAYYYVFNVAYARAIRNGINFVGTDRHSQCWRAYMRSPDPSCKQLGNIGDRMKARRVDADYEGSTKLRLKDDVTRTLEEAHQFEATIGNLPHRFP